MGAADWGKGMVGNVFGVVGGWFVAEITTWGFVLGCSGVFDADKRLRWVK
jgi:hypothetical protein